MVYHKEKRRYFMESGYERGHYCYLPLFKEFLKVSMNSPKKQDAYVKLATSLNIYTSRDILSLKQCVKA